EARRKEVLNNLIKIGQGTNNGCSFEAPKHDHDHEYENRYYHIPHNSSDYTILQAPSHLGGIYARCPITLEIPEELRPITSQFVQPPNAKYICFEHGILVWWEGLEKERQKQGKQEFDWKELEE